MEPIVYGREWSDVNRLAIYIPDATYDSGDNWEADSENFRKGLEAEYGQKFEYDDIGAGASWPAFITFLETSPIIIDALAVFFGGAKIQSSLASWQKMFQTIMRFAKHSPLLTKEAAAILAIAKVTETLGGLPRSFVLLGFRTTHYFDRIDSNNLNDVTIENIQELPTSLGMDGVVYWFDIESEEKVFRISVDRVKVCIKEMDIRR